MKVLLQLLMFLVCATTPGSAQDPAGEGPLLSLSPGGWKFGKVTQGEKYTFNIALRNTGRKDLVIKWARVTCGCLSVETPKKPIPPGKSSPLVIHLDSMKQMGPIRKHIILASNAANTPQIFIPVEGEIQPIYRLEKRALDLGRVSGDAPHVGLLRVLALPGIVPEVESIAFRHQDLKITTTPFGKVDGEHGLVIRAELPAGAAVGRLAVPVRINLKGGPVDAIRFHVVGEVLGDIRISPQVLTLKGLSKSKSHVATLTLASHKKRPFCVQKVTCHDKRIAIDFKAEKSLTSHRITIRIDPQGHPGILRTRIYVVTDRVDQRTFIVPLTAWIVQQGS